MEDNSIVKSDQFPIPLSNVVHPIEESKELNGHGNNDLNENGVENIENDTELLEGKTRENEELYALSNLGQKSCSEKPDLDSISVKSSSLIFPPIDQDNQYTQSLPAKPQLSEPNNESEENKLEIESENTIDLNEEITQITEIPEIKSSPFKIYCFGSSECDQFPCDDDSFESRRPLYIPLPISGDIQISKILCGGLHTMALTVSGDLYTWGCNDDGVLGRQGTENSPGKVELEFPVDMISAGDSHSVACNSIFGIVYYWGVYRNTHKGKMSEVIREPTSVWQSTFKKNPIEKLLSGYNHTLILSNNQKVYACGDPDTFVLGRMPTKKRKIEQGLKLEAITNLRSDDIFSGGNHAFLKRFDRKSKKNQIFAWGLNNFGQLGLGHTHNILTPSIVTGLSDHDIIDIKGGEHFSIALSSEGKIFTFGRNEEGQLGLGDEETEYFSEPQEVLLAGVKSIGAGPTYVYAMTDQPYSWGNGDRYLLLNGKEEASCTPYEIRYKLLREENLVSVSPGGQHVALLTGTSSLEPQIDYTNECFQNIKALNARKKLSSKKRTPSPLNEGNLKKIK